MRIKISLQSTMRETFRKMATVVKLHHTTDQVRSEGKEKGQNFREQVQHNACALCCYLINSYCFS